MKMAGWLAVLLLSASAMAVDSAPDWFMNKVGGQPNLNVSFVKTNFDSWLYAPVGGAYISPIEGYAVYGLSFDERSRETTVVVYKWTPSKELRCARNKNFAEGSLFAEYLFIDYSGECN